MGSIIGFGKWVPFYYYILITISAKLIKDDILGFENDNILSFQLIIANHKIMILLLGYLSDAFFGFLIYILLLYKDYHDKKKKNLILSSMGLEYRKRTSLDKFLDKSKNEINDLKLENIKTMVSHSDTLRILPSISSNDTIKSEFSENSISNGRRASLIHNDLYENISDNTFKYIILSSCLIVTKEFLNKIVFSVHDIFDYFFLNLLILTGILKFRLNQKIYKHQIFAVMMVTIFSGGCLFACLFIDNYSENSEKKTIIDMFKGKYYIIIILIFLYLILSFSFCTGIVIQKDLMENKFISPFKIIMYKGIIGIIGTTIGLIVSSSLKCDEPLTKIDNHKNTTETLDNYKIFEFFVCSDNYTDIYYYDNFISYFKSLNSNDSKSIEIILLFVYCFLHFFTDLSLILINKFLSPTYYLISESFYSLIHVPLHYLTSVSYDEIIKTIKDGIDNTFNCGDIYNAVVQTFGTRILRFISCFIDFIGYIIYLEIVELKFWGLNENTRKNIEKRAILDGITEEDNSSSDEGEEESTLNNDIVHDNNENSE